MQRRFGLGLLAAVFALTVAGASTAAVVPFTGTLSIQELGFFVQGGGVATINDSGGGHPIRSIHLSGTFASAGGTYVDFRSLYLAGTPGQLSGHIGSVSGNLPLPLTSRYFYEVSRNTNSGSRFGTDVLVFNAPFVLPTGAPGDARLRIHLIPEPGTLVLLGAGVVGLALYGRRKMKH